MDRFICIHGHFYQPPRENPWLEAVETQDSAHPYHDWNERITAECYEPNATARILDDQDLILQIVNNYASISFNFGPTLLSWLEQHARRTYQAVLDADRMSSERFSGHGDAIAQAYNHIILPLANDRDRRTQVRWGIRDFEFRFGRKPEGMWLPETAVDVASLEALAAEGIAFTILEPHQVKRFRAIGAREWTATNGSLDPTMPYRCTLPSGQIINLFVYDGPISRAVAFEKLLARGENLAHRLVNAFSDSRKHVQLVNISTDGETYGHHHRYGDMALAYALHYIEENKLAKLTNYGEFLETHPPTHEVEIAENTSWSCSHGVERWRSDCGCNTGAGAGWNQRWRKPLREALDWLCDRVATIFEREGAKLLRDPWAARDDYIDVILDRSHDSIAALLAKHSVSPAAAPSGSTQRTLELLEMQRNAMLMYTSCGWFFNDVSGIETVQVLQYAARVMQLAEGISGQSFENDFLDRIGSARSNLAERGTAREIYEREVIPTRVDLSRVAAHYAVASLFDNFDDDADIYCYKVSRRDFEIQKAGRARLAVGSITVRSLVTLEEGQFDFAVLHLGETELTGGVCAARTADEYETVKKELVEEVQPGGIPGLIRLLDTFFSESTLSIRSLFRDEQRRIFNLLCNATLEEAESAFRQLHERYDPLMRFHTRLGIPVPKVLKTAAEFDLNVQLRKLLEQDNPPLAEIESRLREASDEKVSFSETTLMTLQQAVERAAVKFFQAPNDLDRLEAYDSLVSIINAAQLPVNLRQPQNMYYEMKRSMRPIIAADTEQSREAEEWLALFDALGEKLSISAEAAA
jgi:alpha-amylase/alpha-mannosidase (GH57 family)